MKTLILTILLTVTLNSASYGQSTAQTPPTESGHYYPPYGFFWAPAPLELTQPAGIDVGTFLDSINNVKEREKLATHWLELSAEFTNRSLDIQQQWVLLQQYTANYQAKLHQLELEKYKLQLEIEKLKIERLKLEKENLQLRQKLDEKSNAKNK
jgi:hypothetical protein